MLGGDMAALHEQEEDTEGEEQERTDDGAAPEAAKLITVGIALSFDHVALGTGLLLEDLALILPVASVGRTRWRVLRGWRIGSHGLAPFLVVLAGGDDGVGRSGRGWRSDRLRRVGIGWEDGVVRDAAEDRHQTGDDDEERPTVIPGEDVEGVQKEEDADESDPDGAAEGVEDSLPVAGGAVVGQTAARVRHLVNEDPDADSDQEERNEPVHGEAVEHAHIRDEEDAAETDEPDGTGGEAVSRDGEVR